MTWKAISEADLWDLINSSWDRMSPPQKKMWDAIKILPQKWQENTYGELGNGFWVVAIFGKSVIWYNDIEDGFNSSSYSEFGKIDDYFCNQDELELQVQFLINEIENGPKTEIKRSLPKSL